MSITVPWSAFGSAARCAAVRTEVNNLIAAFVRDELGNLGRPVFLLDGSCCPASFDDAPEFAFQRENAALSAASPSGQICKPCDVVDRWRQQGDNLLEGVMLGEALTSIVGRVRSNPRRRKFLQFICWRRPSNCTIPLPACCWPIYVNGIPPAQRSRSRLRGCV
jgi:hypothetical protein